MSNSRLLLAALVFVACRPVPPAEPLPPPGPTPAEIEARRVADSIAEADRMAQIAAAEAERAQAERAERARQLRAIIEETVYFDYDASDIRSDTKDKLLAKIEILRDHTGIELRLEGHADERGTSEYNIVLGSERNEAVLGYLTAYSLDRSRFKTVSFGEEMPVALGSTEGAWARNRRVEFVILSGAEALDP